MNGAYDKLCALLAAAEFSEKEINLISEIIKHEEVSKLIFDVNNVARVIGRKKNHVNYSRNSDSFFQKKKTKNTIADKVVEILIFEAGLSRVMAAHLLMEELQKQHPNYSFPSMGKMGFAEWIDRIAKKISASELIHLVYSVKNRFVGSDKIDWSLKD